MRVKDKSICTKAGISTKNMNITTKINSQSQDDLQMGATVGDLVSMFLESNNVPTGFGVISIHNMPILDAIARREKIHFVPSRGEAGALNMADSYARVSGHLGAAFTSTGTAAGNAAGAMVEAITAGSPVLHITGQIEKEHVGKDRAYIHEAPAQLEMLEAVSKSAYTINDPKEALAVLQQAATDALTAPAGPVSIEIPIDIQKAFIELPAKIDPVEIAYEQPTQQDIDAIVEQFLQSRRPMLMLGGGSRLASEAATRLADMGVGIVTSTSGRAVVPENHPMSLGAFNVSTHIQNFYTSVDFMLIVGSRLRSNETWTYKLRLPENLAVLDYDANADQRCYPNRLFVRADSKLFLEALTDQLEDRLQIDTKFAGHIANVKEKSIADLRNATGPYAEMVDILQEEMPSNSPWVRDVTLSNSMWGNRWLRIDSPTRGVHAVGGGIGQGLPMAIGASIASEERTIAISGDGGFCLCIGELMTAAQEQANFTLILMNDNGYGVIRNIQDDVYGSRHHYSNILIPDFEKIISGVDGIEHFHVNALSDFRDVFRKANTVKGPSIIEVNMTAIGPFKVAFAGPPTKKQMN